MPFRDTSMIWKGVFCLQIPGFILSLVGFGTSTIIIFTYLKNTATAGLWKQCSNDNCYDMSLVLNYKQESTVWLDVSKGMMSIALIGQFATILLTTSGFILALTKMIGWCTAAASAVSVVFGTIGSGVALGELKRIFDVNVTYDPGYSYILFMVGQAFFLVAACLHAVDSRTRPK
ncbi:uncharacterized protein LOC129923707 [Biomphalaria glabrata]|uniref:Uncharacterized protein LOC129923707 n=1 Tax=Biomphalaria glabrata TaxID=6526 RepID=A0A9W2ZAS7_BIOGL|nr:uncharacterized protein LOC129923707 [Biomphalaria glabrata]KAI8730729.1 hypothetical protein BgiMline_031074 [Biomphalaria glabrata]